MGRWMYAWVLLSHIDGYSQQFLDLSVPPTTAEYEETFISPNEEDLIFIAPNSNDTMSSTQPPEFLYNSETPEE